MALSEKLDLILTVTCKAFKKMSLISEKITWDAFRWTNALLNRFLLTDWDLLEKIILDKDPKFVSKFWTGMCKKLDIKLLMFTAYHFQTNEQSEKTNQTVKIALRFFMTANSEIDWITALSIIQTNMNNSSNASTKLTPNELMYEFKIKNRLTAISEKIDGKFMANKNFKEALNATRLRIRQKAIDAMIFVNAKAKLTHDKRYKPLLFKEKDKAYLKFHKGYKLPGEHNRKLSNQKCDPFLIKWRVDRLAYELKLSSKWKVHFVISVTQLESTTEENSYDKSRPHYPEAVEVEEDIEFEKSYEVEKMIDKRERRFEKIMIIQYLIKWLKYDPEYDEWKSLAALTDCMNLVHVYEKNMADNKKKRNGKKKNKGETVTSSEISKRKKGRPRKKLKNDLIVNEPIIMHH